MKPNKRPSPSPNQKNTKTRVAKKEPQSNYIIIQTNKQKQQQPKSNVIELQRKEQQNFKQDLGIKQVQSSKVLNSSLQSIDSPQTSLPPYQPPQQSQFGYFPQNKIGDNQQNQYQQQQYQFQNSQQQQMQQQHYYYQQQQQQQQFQQQQQLQQEQVQQRTQEMNGIVDYGDMIDYQEIYTPYSYYQSIDDNLQTPQNNYLEQTYQQNQSNNHINSELNQLNRNQNSIQYDNKLLQDNTSKSIQPYQFYPQNPYQSYHNASYSNVYPASPYSSSSYKLGLIRSHEIQLEIQSNTNKYPQYNHFVNGNNSEVLNHNLSSQNQIPYTMKQISQQNYKVRNFNIDESNINQFNIKKKWEVFDLPFKNTIASVLTEKNVTFIKKFDPEGLNPEITTHKIDYKFIINPSQSIAIDQKNGRLFMYDNNDNILVFSQDLDFNQGKPLIKLSLEEKFPRRNPILFLKSYEHYSLLFVIGGFVKQQTVQEIKVFKIEKRNASIKYELTINTILKRRNPIVFTYSQTNNEIQNKNTNKDKNNQNTNQQINENEEEEVEYLVLLGGNSHDAESESNITGEFIEMNTIHELINKRNNLEVEIKNKLKIRLHSSFDDAYEIVSYLTSSYVVVWEQEEEEQQSKSKLLIFSEKIKNVLEVKKIDLGLNRTGDGIIDIIYSDLTHKGHRGLMRIEGNYLSYFDSKAKDLFILSLSESKIVYSTQKKTTFFAPKKPLQNQNKLQEGEKEEEEEYSEDEDNKQIQSQKDQDANNDNIGETINVKQNNQTSKESQKNIEAKDTKDQSQSLPDKKNLNNEQPEQFLSNNNLQNENNPLQNDKTDEQKEKNEKGAEEEEEDELDESEASKKEDKNKNKKQSKKNVNSNKNKKCVCKCNVFQMHFFL